MKSKLWTKVKTLLAAAGLLAGALFGATAVCQLDKENALPVYAEEVQEEVTQADALVETWDISASGNDSVTANLYEYADNAGTYYLEISGTGEMKNFSYSSRPWYNYRTTIDKVTIIDGVTSIGQYAFSGCSSLTSIEIPDGVTSIGGCAFYNCSSLTEITIPDSVTLSGEFAFYNCSSLTEVYITDIAAWCAIDFAYQYSSPLYYAEKLYVNNELVTELIIPDGVTSIGGNAFRNCRSLTNIEIPNGVTSIGGSAFYDCTGLTSINIPDSVTSIGSAAFHNCYYLTSIKIPNSQISIGSYTFYSCGRLTSIEIPDGVTWIGDYAFYGCRGLTNIHLPDGVKTIGESAFRNCSGLASINLPDTVKTIGQEAFRECSSLTSIDIPDSVTSSIGLMTFYGCSSLTNATIGNGVTVIWREAFYGCSNLRRVTIGNSVTLIDSSAFSSCSSLRSVEIPDNVTTINGTVFSYCSNLAEIKFFSKTTTIYDSASTISDTATIYGYTGSTAEAYAIKYGRNFVALQSYDNCAFVGTNVTLGADITVNYYVNLDEANAGLQMRITMNDKSVVVDGESTGIVSDGLTRYVFRFTGVAPQYIGDNILAEWFAVDGESEITVLTKDNYSVKSYCETLLTYSASDLGMTDTKYAAMETLIADLLHYGSAAQVYTEYKTDNLVDASATGGSAFATLEETDEELVGTAIEGFSFYSATVFFDSVNTIRVQIKAEDIGKVSMLVCRNGVPVAICTAFSALGENTYAVETEGILATEFGDLFTFTIYVDGVQGQSFVYSVNSYVYSMQNDGNTAMANLAKATYNYGAAAKRYSFAK